uniref:ORF19 n=1 Tax=Nitrosopumilaceae spindle-shaped virus TaxID=3065433 RepID=A0AAT9J7M6_9VIRU
MIQKRVQLQVTKVQKRKPSVIQWKGVDMVRKQSFMAAVQEIITYSDEMDVTRIGIIGDMHSGKTTLSKCIGHVVHSFSKVPFTVKIFYKKHLMNFAETLKTLHPTNYILIFDDVSFLKASASNKQINLIEQAISEIRHLDGGEDVKIICIFNYHYPKALPPFLREAQYKFITSIGDANEKNIADTYGKQNVNLITGFKIQRKNAIVDKFWLESVGDRPPVKYEWRNPFIPVLFWNESRIRKIIAPTRQFIDPICSDCDESEGIEKYDEKTVQEVCDDGQKKYGSQTFDTACKLLMLKHGENMFSHSVRACLKWIERERKTRSLPVSAIKKVRGYEEKGTQVHKKQFEESVQVI